MQDLKELLRAFVICAFAQACDIVSSLWFNPKTNGLAEANPFARHADGTFFLYHGIVLKTIFLGEFSLIALALYFALYRVNRTAAVIAAMVPLFYFAFNGFDAAVTNAFAYSGWYQSVSIFGVTIL